MTRLAFHELDAGVILPVKHRLPEQRSMHSYNCNFVHLFALQLALTAEERRFFMEGHRAADYYRGVVAVLGAVAVVVDVSLVRVAQIFSCDDDH